MSSSHNCKHSPIYFSPQIHLTLCYSIFLNMLEELNKLREKEQWSPSCPSFQQSRNRWRVLRGSRAGKSRMDGLIKIGDDRETGDGLEVSQENLVSALTALNNFIYEHHEFYS